ncbi:hypothetical protein [Aliterella atlantica]|uniref:Uncharacterized protein n=1 Tax=Aliterella atlantica CENA595 TaxID=1618023 RepID=A0A0D8ZSY8_9CYAN|nr:hypothetical protein [Aliterella atlantica]KJH71609.1 hypothetical protein UH38_11070 [Aliterella atlantica CENA595]
MLFNYLRPVLTIALPTLFCSSLTLHYNSPIALAGGGNVCVLETENPNIKLNFLSVTPSSVSSGTQPKGEVRISTPAPAGGITIMVGSTFHAANPGYCVVIPKGKVSQSFDIRTYKESTTTSGNIYAGYGSTFLTVPLTVRP